MKISRLHPTHSRWREGFFVPVLLSMVMVVVLILGGDANAADSLQNQRDAFQTATQRTERFVSRTVDDMRTDPVPDDDASGGKN